MARATLRGARLLSRIDVGHTVLDEFHFGLRNIQAPEPGTLSLLSFGPLGLWTSRKRVAAAR